MVKFLLLTLMALLASSSAFTMMLSKDDAVKKDLEVCAKDNKFDFAEFKAGNNKEIMDKMEFKCTMKCLVTKLGAFNDDGEANIAKIIEKFPIDEGKLKAAVEKCKGLHNEENLCEKIGGRGICIGNELKEVM